MGHVDAFLLDHHRWMPKFVVVDITNRSLSRARLKPLGAISIIIGCCGWTVAHMRIHAPRTRRRSRQPVMSQAYEPQLNHYSNT